ncbi:unnamed protein product (macronuclear) [Paramecium tetraurelia]|uniref:Protein kinase domain-containing protein n=1 Tax=Paramecium tetraurelia TaxID=5888 RepID=A0CNY6_PARTE|nr:uncharacterized protein GSPATT00038772001 [Paramecium tetraurelia]CAK72503.1 unnamed protein product [Paramecium tetraurelia]|eukprot:XP_001439900.1 hypothetical protein (macronuclear) [Paramecium tetraurelia strain d4-2]
MDQSQRFVLVKAILPQKDMHYVSLINEQLKLQKKYPQYILAINGYDFFEDKTLLQITYNCSKYAKSLTEVQFKTQEEKFRIFDQLIEIAEFLEKNKILHNNIKKNNLIIDHNKLYLTDFGYIAGQPDLNIFRNKLNFINLNLNQKKQIYPYLTKGLMEAIITYNERQLKQKLEKREPIEIMQYDQHVLTSLMVEIFSPLEWNNCDLSYLKDFSFSQKIGYIKINNLDLQDYAIVIIEQILNFRFQKENQLTLEFPRRLEPMLKKIDKQRVLNNKNLELVEDYFKNKDFEFDLGLLYCFTTCKLLELETQVEQSGKEFDCKLRKEISRILAILNMIDNQIFQKKDFEKLESLDDKLFCLAYLDEQFETFEISKNRDQTQENREIYQIQLFFKILINRIL